MEKLLRILHLKKDNILDKENHTLERDRRIFLTIISGIVAQGLSNAIPLITTKFSLNYLGVEIYGLWMAITSFFSFFVFADLGLGNGLQTELSRAVGKDDNIIIKKLISSAFFLLMGISFVLILIFLFVYPYINWDSIMNVKMGNMESFLGKIIVLIVLSKLLSIPLGLIQRIQNSFQEGYKSNLWSCISVFMTLLVIMFVVFFDFGKLNLIGFSAFIPVLVLLLNIVVFFFLEKKELTPRFKYFDKKITVQLLNTGIAFFLLSILTSISLSMDTYIVAKNGTFSETSVYSITFKLVFLIIVISNMISTPLWAANGEALERGEYTWVRKKAFQMALLSLFLSVGASLFLFIIINPLLLWINKELSISFFILGGMCLLQIAVAGINPYFMILNAERKIKCQIFIFLLYSLISLTLKFYFSKIYSVAVIPWIGAISYILIVVPYIFLKAKKIVTKGEKK